MSPNRILRLSIQALGIAILVGLSALLLIHVLDDYRLILTQARERSRLTAHYVAHDLERRFYGIEQMFLGIGDLLTVLGDSPQAHTLIEAVLKDRQRREADFMDLLVVDTQGRIRHWTGTGTPPSVTDRSYVTAHLQNPDSQWFVGPPQWSKVHQGQRFFAVSRAFREPDGHLRHILVAILDLQTLPRAYVEPGLDNLRIQLKSNTGNVYFTVDGISRPRWERPSAWFGLDDTLGTATAVPGTPLGVQARLGTDAVLGPWLANTAVSFSLGALLSLAMFTAFRHIIRQQDRLDFLATTDALSRLTNRGHFMALARKLFTQSRRYDQPLSTLVLDIDDFKQVNDRYGHSQGDRAIQAVARLLREHCRDSDLVGRMGGEEFVMLLPNTTVAGALATADKLLKAVEDAPLGEKEPFSITVSIGVSGRTAADSDLESLINRADQALYRAKRAGKNRVEQLAVPHS
ncbi:two-component system, cell cycle response regulator [Methylomarinovum caldicuralii]|uniref:diguanylate cyclase n=1 Tax=Methylomarinovum caldicuralii TaxID=438856 RepID=A0AAU9C1L6_9GAMM|nr:diguanylate cyclase [Methylomarinovum caldicuralii]BCX81030.1 two-component system, cell cycle response regulator [Methylomarinovum caldicuralii]